IDTWYISVLWAQRLAPTFYPYESTNRLTLSSSPSTPTMKLHAINYLKDRTQSFQYTLGVLASLETQVHAEE
ncbi:hypothetical protein MPER_04823, partial [Moniliophthora perniciosa FA553]